MRRFVSIAAYTVALAGAALALPKCAFAQGLSSTRFVSAPEFLPRRLPPAPATDSHRNGFSLQQPTNDLGSLNTGDDYVTAGELQAELKNHAWKVGQFKVVPYGAFWADMIYATQRTDPGSGTLFVFSRDEQGEDAFTIDARRSRFGLQVDGPTLSVLHGAESGGRVEIDFRGNFVNENRAAVLLRHAYWEAKSDEAGLVVGQTWDVISPLNPNTINYAVGLQAGNIGFRRAQFRLERYVAFSDALLLTLQGSLNQDIVTDFRTEPGVQREASGWPVSQGRLSLTIGEQCDGEQSMEFGVSGHIGETGFDFLTEGPPPLSLPPQDDTRFRTWSFNVDAYVPITDRFGFQGEFFMGANLSAFLGGIGQGVCPCLRGPIRSRGGWFEFWYYWKTNLHSHLGYGLDDPIDRDSLFGRTYNQFIFGNIIIDLTDRFSTGIEVTSWKTLYHERRVGLIPPDQLAPSSPGKAVTIDWMVKYSF